MADIEYLEQERIKLWAEIERIKNEDMKVLNEKLANIDGNISEEIKEFKSSQRSINALKSNYKEYKKHYEDIVQKTEDVDLHISKIKDFYDNIKTIDPQISDLTKSITEKASKLEGVIDKNEDLPNKISSTQENISKFEAAYSKAFAQINKISTEYFKIFGFEDTNKETGEVIKHKGLIAELTDTYTDLQKRMDALESKTKQAYDTTLASWEKQYKDLKVKIEKLLPGAMSAGLAYAFKAKRHRESLGSFFISLIFYTSIISLVVVSALPVYINLDIIKNMQADGKITEIIKLFGKLTWAMIPVYIPIIWVTIFTNKKINLSKKLIEEYSHKEAIAKTFEGLSKQIQDIKDDDDLASKLLRNKLLNATLDATAENPSKCITNHNKSDMPILEILNNPSLIKLIQKDPNKFSELLENFINFIKDTILTDKDVSPTKEERETE